jgi:hypothetical protein
MTSKLIIELPANHGGMVGVSLRHLGGNALGILTICVATSCIVSIYQYLELVQFNGEEEVKQSLFYIPSFQNASKSYLLEPNFLTSPVSATGRMSG